MGKDSGIQWTHHTFNPHWGCAKVSPGCKNCYAETFAKRVGHSVWGEGGERRTFGDKHWSEPLRWNREAVAAGERRRVFCASMADVFEDHPVAVGSRLRLWPLIAETPWLDWLLLTKRPENVPSMTPWGDRWPANVWLGTTCEDQEHADKRIPHLLKAPARVRFVSAEPLLGPLDLRRYLGRFCGCGFPDHPCDEWLAGKCDFEPPRASWVIVGGESGAFKKAREFRVEWARSIVEQCRDAGAAVFVKQFGARPGEEAEGEQGRGVFYLRLNDPKGGDPAEWPEDLRVRAFPEVRP